MVFESSVAKHLGCKGGDDALGMDQRWVAEVVQAIAAEDLCTSLEPYWLLEVDSSVFVQQLGGEDAQSSEQCPAGVDDLDLTIPCEGLGIGRETCTSTL